MAVRARLGSSHRGTMYPGALRNSARSREKNTRDTGLEARWLRRRPSADLEEGNRNLTGAPRQGEPESRDRLFVPTLSLSLSQPRWQASFRLIEYSWQIERFLFPILRMKDKKRRVSFFFFLIFRENSWGNEFREGSLLISLTTEVDKLIKRIFWVFFFKNNTEFVNILKITFARK